MPVSNAVLRVFAMASVLSAASTKRSSVIRSLICIAATALIGGVSVWRLNRTSDKDVHISAPCKKMSLPVRLSLKLDELESVHLNSYKGQLQMIDKLSVSTTRRTHALDDKKQLTFNEKSAEETGALSPPSFLIQPQPRYGQMTIDVGENAELRIPESTSTTNASLEVGSNRADDTKLALQMDAVKIEANRVVIQEFKGMKELEGEDSLRIFASNKTALISAEFGPLPPREQGSGAVALIAYKEPKATPLISSENNAVNVDGRVNLSGCLAPDIKIAGEDPPKEIRTSPLDITLQAKGMALTDISIDPTAEATDKYVLKVRLKGSAESVKQDNRELISTTLEEILNKSATEKGLYGLGALLCIFAGGVFLKRALDVLAAILIPGEGTKNGG